MIPYVAPVALLLFSNIFMTFAWVSGGSPAGRTKQSGGLFRAANARSVSDGPEGCFNKLRTA
jgi:hypothetical protein